MNMQTDGNMELSRALLQNLNDHVLLSRFIARRTGEGEKAKGTESSAKGSRERVHTNPGPAHTKTPFLQVRWDLGPFTRSRGLEAPGGGSMSRLLSRAPGPDQTAHLPSPTESGTPS